MKENVADLPQEPMRPIKIAATARWRAVRLSRSLGEYTVAWDQLNQRLFDGHPMLGSIFIDGLLRHFGAGDERLCIRDLAGRADAMCILKPRNRWLWSTFRPSQAQMGSLLLRGTAALEGLIHCLPGHVQALDLLCVDPDYVGQLEGAEPSLRLHHALTMSIRLDGGFDGYMAGRSGNLRKNLRRYVNRTERDDLAIDYRMWTAPDDVAAAVARYAEIESSGWKGDEGTAISFQNEQGDFYREVMVNSAMANQATVYEMWLGEKLAASRMLVCSDRMAIILKTTYDEDMGQYAPGRLLLKHVVDEAFRSAAGTSLEFYTDATQDQLSWATHSRAIYNIRLCRNVASGFLLHSLRSIRHVMTRRPGDGQPGVSILALDPTSAFPADVVALFETARERSGIQASEAWYRLLVQQVFGTASQPTVFVLRHGDCAVAALPLHLQATPYASINTLGNFYTSYFAAPIAPWLKADDLRPLIQAARRHWPSAASWNTGPVDPCAQSTLQLRAALEAEGLVPYSYFRFGNWSLRRNGIGWSQYYAQRSGSIRSTVSRMSRRFDARNGRLELISNAERVEAGIHAYETVYAASWKVAEPHPEFVRELIRVCAANGWLRLGIAWLGEQPIAAQLWIVMNRRADIFKLAYDENFKTMSPGTLLTAMLMQHVFEQDQVEEVDYLSGDDPHKRFWMNRRVERRGIVAHDPRRLRGFIGCGHEAGGRLVKAIMRRTEPRRADPPHASSE